MRELYFIILISFSGFTLKAQPWMNAPYMKINSRADSFKLYNFYEIQKAFNLYEKKHDAILNNPQRHLRETLQEADKDAKGIDGENEGKFAGYAQYKRWEWYMEQRIYPSGDISLPGTNHFEFQKYLSSQDYRRTRSGPQANLSSANWIPLGPTGTHLNGYWGGAARINFIRFDPANSNKIWIGSPSGGVWSSIDGGANWATNTDNLTEMGCSDIAIDPTNSNIMYLATGDANGTSGYLNSPSLGVLKSIDGGVTWNTTGLTWAPSLLRGIYKVVINPASPNIVYAATSIGVYRTINSGTSWTLVLGGATATDIKFKPSHPNTVYAALGWVSSGKFYRSTNDGINWTNITSGYAPTASIGRQEIGVTDADSNYVYVVDVNLSYSFYGMFRSTDGGTSFTQQSNSPDILTGPAGSQAWYNLAMAVSSVNKDKVLVGGTNCWRTLDGGVTWAINSDNTNTNAPFVHPDCHALAFLPGSDNTYFSGNDGGIWKTTNNGAAWTDINIGLQIAQMYRLGTSSIHPYTILTGLQDEGFHLLENGNWSLFALLTGDGMEGIIDPTTDNTMYFSCNQGHLYKTANHAVSFTHPATIGGAGVNATANWITPNIMNPLNRFTLLIGKAQVYRTYNSATTWTQVGNVTGGATNIIALAYSPSDTNYIYVAKTNKFFVATDGNTFVDRTGTLPVASASISFVAVSNTNPSQVWVTFSGYSAGNKVWYSADAGITWSNYSTGLPNLPVNCIAYQNASNDGLYVGTDVGVYFIDKSSPTWQPFFTGLPNVNVQEMEINFPSGKIRAATNGRGLWESDLAVAEPTLITWVGGVSTDWNNPLNWSPNAVPASRQDVIIPEVPVTNYYPTVNAAGMACHDLTINTNAVATVFTGIKFKVTGNLTLY